MQNNKKIVKPQDGLSGFLEHFTNDVSSGFLVFLIALPLSLGIAKASDFPPIMGLITAMIGGLVVSLFSGSLLTIKGPAAGLIVIVAGSVSDFGKGDAILGWQLALGALFVAGFVQILFGLIKMGSLADFFPLSAVHGMLAAIGIIIMSKQIHVLLGVNPLYSNGRPMIDPILLLRNLPATISKADVNAAIIGFVSLFIVLFWSKIPIGKFRKIPAPLVVLLLSIPLAKFLNVNPTQLIQFDQNLGDALNINVRFNGIQQFGTFFQYVLMFALVGSLESLLTVKAIDQLDPYQRKSNANKDLVAVGIGNMICSVLGGLPMIAEVARSSANVNQGAKTRWSNFFHGVFVFVFLLTDIQFSGLIPYSALAAMLIGVGVKLASPKELGRMAKIGPEQLLVFCVTIAVTLFTDLLIGISIGILVKLLSQFLLGVPLKSTFKANVVVSQAHVRITGAAVFSNWLGIKRSIDQFQPSDILTIDFSQCNVVDHTVMDHMIHLENEFHHAGGTLLILGLEQLTSVSASQHPLSTRKRERANRLDHFGNSMTR